ncbi:MAG: 30S ribosomal protein S17 [Candidatus Marinimicrobia bacterium]|jgi:small subunit ribosomal protein S17|nr:30S ribosomal protein S17 [Candidatus Neomarinimicrobiota bacterium]
MTTQEKRKVLIGTVVSNKMDKTIVISVERTVKHATYGKYVRRTSKFYANDPENKCTIGDVVKVGETRPLSRLKRWSLLEIVKSAEKE